MATLLSLVVVFACTLFPFRMQFENAPVHSVRDALLITIGPDKAWDVLENVLLFLPLGFTLRGYFAQKRVGPLAALTAVLFLSAGLSYAVEVIQVFMPGRFASLTDVASNVAGAGVGALFYAFWTRLNV